MIRSVSKVTTALSIVSSVFQLFFLVVCSSAILKGFGVVAFFASVETSSICIHPSCLSMPGDQRLVLAPRVIIDADR